MLENYSDIIEAAKILDVHPETVEPLIREGKLAATKSLYDTYEDGHNRRSNSAHMANAIQVSLVTGYSS